MMALRSASWRGPLSLAAIAWISAASVGAQPASGPISGMPLGQPRPQAGGPNGASANPQALAVARPRGTASEFGAPAEPPRPPAPPFNERARPVTALSQIQLHPGDLQTIIQVLDDGVTHGFKKGEFAPANLAEMAASPDPAVRAEAEAAAKLGVIRYARAQHGQRVPLQDFPRNWSVRPAPYTPDYDFAKAVAENRLGAWLESLAPNYEGYRALRRALAQYRDIAAHGGWQPVPLGPSLGLGVRDARVAALRARLAVEDPKLAPANDPELFDQALAEAVMRYQWRNGLNTTGIVDRDSQAALNAPVGQRILQIIANLERWRWMPAEISPTRIEVNIPAGGMTVYSQNRPVLGMRAVAGRPTDQSPMLMSAVESIVVNPPWNVPPSIAMKEEWPKERAHPGYLASHGFRVISDGQGGVRLQQIPSASALGKLKFDFPSPFGVYLHDTPTRSTFAHDTRAASHGCVRLEHPFELATMLLQEDPEWRSDNLQAAIDSGDTSRVHLQHPMPLAILYWTVFVAGGQVNFRTDYYNWDQRLLKLIDQGRGLSTP